MSMGSKVLVDAVFADVGLNDFLDGLKRDQGEKVSAEVKALVATSVDMTGVSVNRLDRMLDDDLVRKEYGLGNSASRSIYRTVDRIGKSSDAIVRFLAEALKTKYGVGMDTVFLDWTSMYFEAPQNVFVRIGYSRDHRPDRPQVTVGLSVDKASGMPIGLTIMPGNVVDVTHFQETFKQMRSLLPDDAMIVFDNGAYSKENSALLERGEFGFVTLLQMNASDDAFVRAHEKEFVDLGDGMSFLAVQGNLGRKRFIFRSETLRSDALQRYRAKAERDYDDMVNLKAAVEGDRRPRKKYRTSNCFVDTHLSYRFPLDVMNREEAIEHAVRSMFTGREGLFVLLTNRSLTASETLKIYRSRNAVETAFRDLKHGIDWRPARCTSEDAIKGRILISFLALFCMSMVRFLHPELSRMTAESLVTELASFSLTVERRSNGVIRRIWSNFSPIIRYLGGRKRPLPVPSAPGQAVLDRFPG